MLSLALRLYFRSTSTAFSVWRDTVKQSAYRMDLEFAIRVMITLLMFRPATSKTCEVAYWWDSLDTQGWSLCPSITLYLIGFWRSDKLLGDERVGRIEYGRCCKADEPSYAIQLQACLHANWASTLDG